MNKNTLQILWLGIFLNMISMLYFLSLAFYIPFIVVPFLALGCGVMLYRYFLKHIKFVPEEKNNKAMLVLSGCIVALTAGSAILVRKNGDIDSISNWNFLAAYIADKDNWKNLFVNSGTDAHPDYPLGYPAAIAFFWRLFDTREEIVSLAITYIPTLCIPVLVFLQLYKRHLPIAIVTFLLFLTNVYYVNLGLSQYADTLLSFYLLGAIIAMYHYKQNSQPLYILLCTALLGCSLWVKNEGVAICGIFALFYFRTFISKANIKYTLAGIIPFLLTFAFFKLAYAPANDLVALSDNVSFGSFIADKSRYKLILHYFSFAIDSSFYPLKIMFFGYLGYCIFTIRNMSKSFYMLLTILGCYLLIYLFTPRDLDWHLRTSMGRLIAQLFPSFILVLGLELSQIRIPTMNIKSTN